MADIFIAYAQEDRERMESLARALATVGGWSVWWDRDIPFGKPFDQVIEEALMAARCIIVVWSSHSIHSYWVIEEAEQGRQRGILIPILIERVSPPFGFRRIQTLDLSNWKSSPTFPEFQKLVTIITSIIGPVSAKEHSEARERIEARIREARRTSARVLDLSSLGLMALPEALGQQGSRMEGDDPLHELALKKPLPAKPGFFQSMLKWVESISAWNEEQRGLRREPWPGQLTRLQTLNVSSNQLTALPEALGERPKAGADGLNLFHDVQEVLE